jgi:dynein intermediate chain 2
MEVAHQYARKRAVFGQHVVLEDVPAAALESLPDAPDIAEEYVPKNPVFTTLDTCLPQAEHEANTDLVIYKNQGMRHFEGGWPENVDSTEADQVDRFLKKTNKDPKFKATIASLGRNIEQCVKQNNTMDIYEQYFQGPDLFAVASEPPSMKNIAVFKDPSPVKRTVTSINWHPEGNKIAVAYSILKFQDERMLAARLPASSYVWDLSNSNVPLCELTPPSPLVSLRFNAKTPDIICGGSYNGMVHVFDIRKPRNVGISSSAIDRSHHDPVCDVFWIQSKTNNQFVSVSTDGRMLWWDTRKLSEPTGE